MLIREDADGSNGSRGRPLASEDGIVQSIAATTIGNGLMIHAELDIANCPAGVKISKECKRYLETHGILICHCWHGAWNYRISPTICETSHSTDLNNCGHIASRVQSKHNEGNGGKKSSSGLKDNPRTCQWPYRGLSSTFPPSYETYWVPKRIVEADRAREVHLITFLTAAWGQDHWHPPS